MIGDNKLQRLDKILSNAGVASRKELKGMIRAGRIKVNGMTVKNPEEKFDELTVQLTVDGVDVRKNQTVVLMLHKPAGYVTSTADPRDRTVMELISKEYRKLGVKPVGRLDKETEGLLLFTNDGDLAHRIISPKKEIWKTYFAKHEGTAREEDIHAFREGLILQDGTKCLPGELIPQGKGESLIRICEGKYHQVRRMMASRGMSVLYLKRTAEGNLTLGDLPLGAFRELTAQEISHIL